MSAENRARIRNVLASHVAEFNAQPSGEVHQMNFNVQRLQAFELGGIAEALMDLAEEVAALREATSAATKPAEHEEQS